MDEATLWLLLVLQKTGESIRLVLSFWGDGDGGWSAPKESSTPLDEGEDTILGVLVILLVLSCWGKEKSDSSSGVNGAVCRVNPLVGLMSSAFTASKMSVSSSSSSYDGIVRC